MTPTPSKTRSVSRISRSKTPTRSYQLSIVGPSRSESPPLHITVTPSISGSPSPSQSKQIVICGNQCNYVPDDSISEVQQNSSVPITVDETNNVGAVVINSNTIKTASGILVISEAVIPTNTDLSLVLSSIVELTLFDSDGNEISLLENSVKVCLEVPETEEDLCLSYLDTSVSPPEWKCQDPCLTRENSTYVCGDTGHFTSFAVLLDGTGGDGCGGDSSGANIIIQWLSFSSLILAGGLIIGSVVVLEVWQRRQRGNKKRGAVHRAAGRRQKMLASLRTSGDSGNYGDSVNYTASQSMGGD
jgi:hypothetical protein